MDEAVTFQYVFTLEDGRSEKFEISLNEKLELELIQPPDVF